MSTGREKIGAFSRGDLRPPPIMTTLGMELIRVGEGVADISMDVDSRFHNPMGTVHGGIVTDLADAAMGVAMMSTLKAGESFTTLELKMNFLRPVTKARLTAEAKVVHRGKTIGMVEMVVKNGEGKVVARGTATQLVTR